MNNNCNAFNIKMPCTKQKANLHEKNEIIIFVTYKLLYVSRAMQRNEKSRMNSGDKWNCKATAY